MACVGIPSRAASITFVDVSIILAHALNSIFIISSPYHCCCLAFFHLPPSKHHHHHRHTTNFQNSYTTSLSPTDIEMTSTESYDDGSLTSSSSSVAVEINSSSPAFRSLQKFVDDTISKNSQSTPSTRCQLVPSDAEDDEMFDSSWGRQRGNNGTTITAINTIIFRPVGVVVDDSLLSEQNQDAIYAVAIVPSSERVDVRLLSEELVKIQEGGETPQHRKESTNTNNYYTKWELAPSDIVRDLCGFEPGTIPPLLVPPQKDGGSEHNLGFEGVQRPFATIIDGSLLRRSDNTTANNVNEDDSNEDSFVKQLLLGGGGSIDHRCLITLDFLAKGILEIETNDDVCQSDVRNAKIASIIRFDGRRMPVTKDFVGRVPCYEDNNNSNNIRNHPLEKGPFFQIAPPPGSAVGSINPQESRKDHRPVPVTAIGRITSVRQIAKKLVFADLAPPDYNINGWLVNKTAPSSFTTKYDKGSDKTGNGIMPGPPWRSGEDGEDMHVQIIVGGTFCERFEEDGTARLKSLKPGKLVLVRGAANVDPMQKNGWRNSSGNWAQKRSLDVIVSSFEILDEDDSDDSLRMLVEEAQREVASRGISNTSWKSLLPWERKNDFQRRAVGGAAMANDVTVSVKDRNDGDSGDILTLDRFNSHLRDTPLDIKIVDDGDSIVAMSNDVKELFSLIEKNDEISDGLDYIAGIDCEWRPTGAYAEAPLEGPDDNPVALMQICPPSIGKVYLVDTYRTLRPNLADTEAMTETESILSEAISAIFGSEKMIKVGYSVGVDFRKLAASFPHIPSFRNVRSVVELSTLAERLHPKSARPRLGSLQKLTKLVLGYDIAKEQQCSNWESRPLTPSQIEYATLDCALPPRLLDEMAEGSGNSRIREVLPGATMSWRFQTIDGTRKDAIRQLKAKRVVGNTFLVSQSWLNHSPPPDPTSIPEEGGGLYTDTDGLLKMPADLVSICDKPWKSLSGKTIGGKKKDCIDLLVGDAMPKDAILDYNPRSGFISFQDGLSLFVNIPDPTRPSRRRMPYPNEWLERGKFLKWYIRKNDWDNGNSKVAKLLSGSNDGSDSAIASSLVVLFVRIGTKDFICCGSCTALVADDDSPISNKKLIKLNLRLNDWETMKDEAAFSQLLEATKPRTKPTPNENASSKKLAQTIVGGNIVGAFTMALDASSISPDERSIAQGVRCVKKILQSSDDPLVLEAKEIIDNMIL
mmetsp:Transcript_9703/g.23712  ORF Transcript_9703/g.23712 Transcript_9703/m.23712 type:complete len:1207 (+) Transcript_9703:189-3809(+)